MLLEQDVLSVLFDLHLHFSVSNPRISNAVLKALCNIALQSQKCAAAIARSGKPFFCSIHSLNFDSESQFLTNPIVEKIFFCRVASSFVVSYVVWYA